MSHNNIVMLIESQQNNNELWMYMELFASTLRRELNKRAEVVRLLD